jgi:hypothetical protein
MFNQGLGKPQMTVEDRICDMMMQLDEHSDNIPEGVYLQFCDHLKVFHQNVQMSWIYSAPDGLGGRGGVVVVESLVTIGGIALGFWGRTSFACVGWSKNRARNARLEELEDNITLAQLLE